ncbi:CbtA family protein [Mycolicibacterium confluentis]|uniref:Cobalt transporter n=1 Tax=Mycolicibacterium confluentis TaxID=28047 RepID=A0A7I7XQE8_9MYCO|nr:CbtA family protein [Mycolicibacterium confluentis]MCV7322409.1 CbtA family protein [Mycolicibacterium confluentis]ORV22428.1 cobalt transporter [Mycolicibacterium confluentis]BBZ31458.1 cobalt transporter [Mycolicibacterium confluentis]
MEKHVIWRGILAGALAGVLAFIWSWVFIEPVIDRAIDFEDGVGAAHEALEHAHEHGHSHAEGGFEITRTVQSTVGLGFGLLAFGVAMGALLAVVFCVVYNRTNMSARALAALTAGGMLVSLWIVPSLKYPPNPPAVSADETLNQRTLLYVLIVGVSIALMVAAVFFGRRLAPKLGTWNAALAAAGAYIVAVAVVYLVLPAVDETPGPLLDESGAIVFPGFPADDLYEFRLYSLGAQVVLWATIGLVFGVLVSRLLENKRESVSA